MTSFRAFLFILVGLAIGFSAEDSLAETQPTAHVTIIDGDGQVSPTQWRSSSTWIWSQNHLLLQTAIEIPSHIAATLPASMSSFVRGPTYQGPFKLQDDHQFLILELRGPSEIFKLGSQTMRVNVDFDHTNWMRNANCREANVSLAEVEGRSPSAPNAFFISIFCKPARNGTWIEVAASDEVSLSFEPHGQIRFQNTADQVAGGISGGTQFWLPRGPHPRVLSDIIVTGGSGEVSARYELSGEPIVSEKIPMRKLADDAEPILFRVDETSVGELPSHERRSPLFGITAQVVDAHSPSSGAQGQSSAEFAVTARAKFFDALNAELEMPIRRLGAGLDEKGAGTHLGFVNVGYEYPVRNFSWVFGAQATVLDVHTPSRETVFAVAPSMSAQFGPLYSITLAPIDLVSNFSFARARADLPLTQDRKNRLTFEALIGRTLIQPQAKSWNANGISVGFAGEF